MEGGRYLIYGKIGVNLYSFDFEPFKFIKLVFVFQSPILTTSILTTSILTHLLDRHLEAATKWRNSCYDI